MVRYFTKAFPRYSILGLAVAAAASSGCGLRLRNLSLEEAQSIAASVCAPEPAAILPAAERALRAADGVSLNDSHSAWPSISANGRYLAFHTWSTNLIPGVTGTQSYVYDLITRELEIVSKKADGTRGNATAGDGTTALSCSGRYAVFVSRSTNLTSDTVNGTTTQIFFKDRETGEIELVTKSALGAVATGASAVEGWTGSYPAVSYDGRYVVFATKAANLGFAGANWKVLRKDRETGAFERVSETAAGVGTTTTAFTPAIDPTGHLVLYYTYENWNGNTGGFAQLYLKNMITGENRLLSKTAAGGAANGSSSHSRMSGDGRYAVFTSAATNLDAGAYTHQGAVSSVFRVRLSDGEIEWVGPGLTTGVCCARQPGISYDGGIVAWHSNVAFASLSANSQICAKDLESGEVTLVSRGVDGAAASAGQELFDLSADGRWVGFQGLGTNLVPATAYQANWQLYTLPTGFAPSADYRGERR